MMKFSNYILRYICQVTELQLNMRLGLNLDFLLL